MQKICELRISFKEGVIYKESHTYNQKEPFEISRAHNKKKEHGESNAKRHKKKSRR